MFVEVSRDRRSRLKGIERVWYQFTNFESVLLDRMDQNGLRLIHLGCCHEFHYLKERHWLLKSAFFSGLFIVYWLGFVQGLASFSVKIVATGSVLIAQIHWCIHWCIHPSIHPSAWEVVRISCENGGETCDKEDVFRLEAGGLRPDAGCCRWSSSPRSRDHRWKVSLLPKNETFRYVYGEKAPVGGAGGQRVLQ